MDDGLAQRFDTHQARPPRTQNFHANVQAVFWTGFIESILPPPEHNDNGIDQHADHYHARYHNNHTVRVPKFSDSRAQMSTRLCRDEAETRDDTV